MNNTTYTVKEFVSYVLRKWWAVALAVVLLAAILGGPKLMDTKVEGGATVIASEIVMVENNAKIVDQNTNIQKYEDYSDMWMRDTSLSVFFTEAAQRFDMEKLCAGWDSENLTSQIKWFKKQVICKTIPNTSKYEFHFTLPATAETYAYVHENAQAFVDAFVEYSVGLSQKEVPAVDYQVLNNSYREIPSGSGSSAAKYLLLGGIMGGILAVFVLGVMFLGSRKLVSKNMLLSRFDVDSIDQAKELDYDVFCYLMTQSQKSGRRAFVLSSSIDGVQIAQAIKERFDKCGYALTVADIRGKRADGLGNQASKSECDALTTPGRCGEMVRALTDGGRYLLILSDMPAQDALASALIDESACAVFVEGLYKSDRKMVERSIEVAYQTADQAPICIAWEK